MAKTARVSIVVAMSAHDRGIGKKGTLLWHIPDDLKRFKQLTVGHPVIMGRKTFESIVQYLGGPLPGRTNIVVTRNSDYRHAGAKIFNTLDTAFQYAKSLDDEVFIGGGSELYEQALPYTDRLYLTLIDEQKPADSFFPAYSNFTKEISREKREHNGIRYTWLTLE
ncbi:MAG TPA: dihydrofolate reductase [Candidatus Paceibacterota bacterium]|jgi:dihydrofolate reductase